MTTSDNGFIKDPENFALGGKLALGGLLVLLVLGLWLSKSLKSFAEACNIKQQYNPDPNLKCTASMIVVDGHSWFLWGGLLFFVGGGILCLLSLAATEQD